MTMMILFNVPMMKLAITTGQDLPTVTKNRDDVVDALRYGYMYDSNTIRYLQQKHFVRHSKGEKTQMDIFMQSIKANKALLVKVAAGVVGAALGVGIATLVAANADVQIPNLQAPFDEEPMALEADPK